MFHKCAVYDVSLVPSGQLRGTCRRVEAGAGPSRRASFHEAFLRCVSAVGALAA